MNFFHQLPEFTLRAISGKRLTLMNELMRPTGNVAAFHVSLVPRQRYVSPGGVTLVESRAYAGGACVGVEDCRGQQPRSGHGANARTSRFGCLGCPLGSAPSLAGPSPVLARTFPFCRGQGGVSKFVEAAMAALSA